MKQLTSVQICGLIPYQILIGKPDSLHIIDTSPTIFCKTILIPCSKTSPAHFKNVTPTYFHGFNSNLLVTPTHYFLIYSPTSYCTCSSFKKITENQSSSWYLAPLCAMDISLCQPLLEKHKQHSHHEQKFILKHDKVSFDASCAIGKMQPPLAYSRKE